MRFKISFLLLLVISSRLFAQNTYPAIDPAGVNIVRDSFGVPHIFAKTDAEVAFGLAWANAEDAFEETQNLIYVAKGLTGTAKGVEGAKADFFVHAIGARKITDEKFDTDLTPEFKKYLNGYMQGVNAFAAAHPEKVKVPKAFPITEKDLITTYVVTMSFLVGAQNNVGDAVGGKYDKDSIDYRPQPTVGSNAYAVNSTRTEDAKTYLCVNPHIAMDGPISFYEAHLQSEEGLDMIGNLFQGGTSNAMGTNRHLGWAFTWNYFDRIDVYKLKMNPKNKLQYEFDGKWETLEKRPVKLHVKVKGLKVSVNKMSYWSKYGCTLKSEKANSFYAIRFPANMNIKAAQQLYEMAKATNYTEFWGALRRNHGIALFNMVYADYKNNIFYLSHGAMPDRKNQKYNWAGILPGNTSDNLWTDLVKMDSMPHVINPKSGFVFNSNNNVFDATGEGDNDNPNRLPAYVNERNGNNNRAVLLKEFFASKEKFTMKEFQDVKFTTRYPKSSNFIKSLNPLWSLDKTKYPDLSDAIQMLKTWDLNTTANSYSTTLFAAFIKMVWEKNHYDDYQFVTGAPNLTEENTAQYLRDGVKFMKDNFGSIKVRWGDVHKLRRGDKAIGMGSFVDLLSPSYPKSNLVNGKLEFNPNYGDTYTMFVKYSPTGAESVETLMPLGNSLDPKSKHYTDQMENFVAHKMKKMPFEKSYWIEHAESNYHPK